LASGADVVVVVSCTIVWMLSAKMGHFATVYGIAGGDHDGLMLTVARSSGSSPFANWIRILILAVRSVVDGLVPPVSCTHGTLGALVSLLWLLRAGLHGSVSQVRRNRLYGSVVHYALGRYLFGMSVGFRFAGGHYGVHDKVVGLDNGRMNYRAELLIVLHL